MIGHMTRGRKGISDVIVQSGNKDIYGNQEAIEQGDVLQLERMPENIEKQRNRQPFSKQEAENLIELVGSSIVGRCVVTPSEHIQLPVELSVDFFHAASHA